MHRSTTKLKSAIPRSIWALGFVSLFMDMSSELVHSLLPVFMVTVLSASMTSVGIIEGIAEATALITKVFSGAISDYIGKRKILTVIGYGLAALTKPFFPIANTLSLVLFARFTDRIGKGIRGAPRDALIGEIAPQEIRGACYGLRQTMDTIGAFLGPLLAIFLMWIMADDIRSVLWIAVIPAFISVAILVMAVHEPEKVKNQKKSAKPIIWHEIKTLKPIYWNLVGIASVLGLARFSEAFLIIKAQSSGLPLFLIPVVLVVMNVVYAATSYPAGVISDRVNRKIVLLIGIIFLIAADIFLATADNFLKLWLGIIFWGLHMGFSQGLFAAMIADESPDHLRGTAFGIFNLASGLLMLIASVLAGVLWDQYGSGITFITGAVFSAVAFFWLLFLHLSNRRPYA